MSEAAIAAGTKVELGDPGTPGYRVGLVLGQGSAELLGRPDGDEPSELVAWESGEQEWIGRSLLRVAQ